jgi:hypothetical protein
MKLYDCIVRIGGSLLNEVEKFNVTAPEIIMFQSLHGDDAVREIHPAGESRESDESIRDRMSAYFGTGMIESGRSGADLVRKTLGPKTMPLPKYLEGVEEESYLDKRANPDAPKPPPMPLPNPGFKKTSLTAEA